MIVPFTAPQSERGNPLQAQERRSHKSNTYSRKCPQPRRSPQTHGSKQVATTSGQISAFLKSTSSPNVMVEALVADAILCHDNLPLFHKSKKTPSATLNLAKLHFIDMSGKEKHL